MKLIPSSIISLLLVATSFCNIKAQTGTILGDSIKRVVDKHINNNKFSGIVRISKNDQDIFSSVNGYADEALQKSFTSSTRFSIGSIGKLMTAVLVMKLVEEGKVDVNKTIDTYLPEWKIPNGANITVANILEMRAGLGDYMRSQEHQELRGKTASLDDLMKIVVKQPLQNETAGSKFSYSNSGFIVLGKLVEKMEGKSYFEALSDRILKPLKMNSATFKINFDDVNGFAKGYVQEDGGWKAQTTIIPPASDGGLFITFEDFMKFDKGLFDGKVISKETLDKMKPADPKNYGFGMMRTKLSNGVGYGHNGGMPGYEAEYRHFFIGMDQYTVLIFTNHDRRAMTLMADIKNQLERIVD